MKNYEYDEYKKHYEGCSDEDNAERAEINELKIKILKGLLKRDELSKPFIVKQQINQEYLVNVDYKGENWIINRKFNQFTSLHKEVFKI